MIVPGSTSQSLAAALAAETGRRLAAVDVDRFPDGELLATVPALGGATPGARGDTTRDGDRDADADADADASADAPPARATVVAATTSAESHLELLQLQDACREAGVREVTTVLPYMGYARQDAAFEPGQPVSARAVARAVSTGTDRVVLVNPHEPSVGDRFDVPVERVDACPLLAEPLPADLADPLFLAPDDGAVDLARRVRDAYGRGGIDYFEKTRHSGTEVTVEPSDAAVADRDVVVVDDIVATGSTMSESIALLRERGAGRVFAACVHPVLAGSARTRLATAGVEAVVATDTVERPVSTVSVAPALAEVV